MNQYLLKTGSKVNGLEQPFHTRRVHCLFFDLQEYVGITRKMFESWHTLSLLALVHDQGTS